MTHWIDHTLPPRDNIEGLQARLRRQHEIEMRQRDAERVILALLVGVMVLAAVGVLAVGR